ncbi:DUF3418 domain-containing protein, partial [Neisseria arctica]|uniref:DUF3418 domain-containing protein n=1 Tax=Neisseria arctica TaxID=1470200 RepID=UPI00128D7B0B
RKLHAAAHITAEQFPHLWQTADGKFKLSYRLEPIHPLYGVTLSLPLTQLTRIHAPPLERLDPRPTTEPQHLLMKPHPKTIFLTS